MVSAVRVAVISGGRGRWQRASLASASVVMEGLDRRYFRVEPMRITPSGRWVASHGQTEDLAATTGLETTAAAVTGKTLRDVDVVFPCLAGDDAAVRGFLDLAGVPYVGSGVLVSAVSADKSAARKILAAEGIAVARASARGRDVQIGVLELPDGYLITSPLGASGNCHLTRDVAVSLHELARSVFRVLGCSGMLQVGFLLEQRGGGRLIPVVSEINVSPRFAPFSSFPRLWADGGVALSSLLDVLVETALIGRARR
jgi:D-alanine-D-alanine ligase-like ATP-grasp enzyme